MNKINRRKAFVCLFVLLIALIALDQVVKHYADVRLSPAGTSVPFIGGLVNLRSVHNTGAAFGMFQDGGGVLAAVRLVTSGALVYAMIRWRENLCPFINVVLTVILAGAVGNLADQITRGYVRDMFEFAFINFPVFNMADIYVTLGSAALFAYVLFTRKGRAVLDLILRQQPADNEQVGNENN